MSRPLVQSASSSKQVRRAERVEKQADRLAADDAKAVLATREGRRFVWWLLRKAGVTESVLRGGDGMVLYWAGRQDTGHELLAHVITTDPDAYLLMQREAIEAQAMAQVNVPAEEAGMVSEPPTGGEDDG